MERVGLLAVGQLATSRSASSVISPARRCIFSP